MLLTETLPVTADQQIFEQAKFKIAVEVQRIFRPHKHGMDIVAQELLKRLPLANDYIDYHVMVKEDNDRCLSDIPHRIIHTLKKAPYCIWEQYFLPKACKELKANILHCTANTAPLISETPLILTLHDVIFLEHSAGGINRNWYQYLGNLYRRMIVSSVAKKALKIITVSEFQKKLIMEKLRIPADKITVIHNGADERFFQELTHKQINLVLGKHSLKAGYIFFMANTDPRKNTKGVLKAYAKLLNKNPFAPRLLMKGVNPEQLRTMLQEENLNHLFDSIDTISYINCDELPAIYQGASMLWFPSFSEGFGLPIIEAMAGGTPVITSSISCMPEIAGGAAVLIDPYDPSALATAAHKILADQVLSIELSIAGKQRASKFTWDAATKKTRAVYHEVERMITK